MSQTENVDLDAEIEGLVAQSQSRADQLTLYAGKKANGSTPETQAAESTPTLDPPIDLTQETATLIETGRQHTRNLSSVCETALDAIDTLSRGLRTELREAERRRNSADGALVRTAHKVMSMAPRIEATIRELAAANRASGD
jgi:hypothetical protein